MIRIANREQFDVLRKFLQSAYPYDAMELADRVGDFSPSRHQDEPPLVRMFFLGRAIPVDQWEAVASPEVRRICSELGLIEEASRGRIRCSVLLYKTRGVYVVSDRFMTDEGEVGLPAHDCVYYALTETAQHYIHSLPAHRYGKVLDVGTGSGVASLILAQNSQHVYATDIASRSVLFSEFNKLLNGLENITVREGSFYEPVEGLTFDLITCHPPFDISLSSKKYVYADGGDDGEFVTRGVISGLPKMLNPGGQFVGAVRGTDRTEGDIEHRFRQWLGDAGSEFDIAVTVRSVIRPEEHAISASMLAKQNLDDYQRYMEHFGQLGIQRLPYVHVLIERKAQGTPLTLRRHIGQRCTTAEMEALLAWERVKPSLDISAARLSPSRHVELRVRHKFDSGELTPIDYSFVVEHPFREEMSVPEWVAKLVALCIANRSVDDVYTLMREEYPIPRPDYDAAVKRLVSVGVLQLASGSSTISSN